MYFNGWILLLAIACLLTLPFSSIPKTLNTKLVLVVILFEFEFFISSSLEEQNVKFKKNSYYS
ncbi:hypothetical protein CMT84_05660 [Elizabethkingia anophelis]|nr:hypothetical protein [Elizabethkingia anophelis]